MDQNTLLELIELGCDSWNDWRTDNPGIDINLSGTDFSGKVLSNYDFSEVIMSYCNFSKTELCNTKFISTKLDHANFSFSNLERATFIAADLSYTIFTLAHVKATKFLTAQLRGADFSHVDFTGHSLQGMDFRQAKLSGAHLKGLDLTGMNFAESDLSQADLSDALFQDANLQGANLARALLDGAELQGANLKHADFSHTKLVDKDLSNANLAYAKLEHSDVRYTNLENATLDNAVLTGAKLFKIKNSGWSIKNTRCEYAFWDKEGLDKTRYRHGEFEKLNSESILVELRYDSYMAPHEIATLPILVEHLEANHWGIKLRIKGIGEEAGGNRVKIVVEDTGGHNSENLVNDLKEEASQLLAAQLVMRRDHKLSAEFKESLAQLKNKFWPRLLEMATESKDGHVRMYTVLLMDLKGFSRWRGDELAEKLKLFRGLIRPILKRWKANHPNMEGDSLRASFQSAPVAVTCACMIRNVLQAAGFPCRIGIDFGEVSLEHNEVTEQTDLSGQAVNFASRLESVCEVDEILISERVWHFVHTQQEYFSLEPRTIRLPKGVGNLQAGEEVHCYRVNMVKTLV